MNDPTLKDIQDEIEEIRRIFVEQAQERTTWSLLMKTATNLTDRITDLDVQIRAHLAHLSESAARAAVANKDDTPSSSTKTPTSHANERT